MTKLVIRRATTADAEAIATLINSAYRGESSRAGWTTEADLIDGLRTTTQEIAALIAQTHLFILVGEYQGKLVATICCEHLIEGHQHKAKLGMISVQPNLQNQGFGKQMILAAEANAIEIWPLDAFCMTVITARASLIAFYNRLGYLPTGVVKPFPYESDLWQVKVEGLQFAYFEKPVCHPSEITSVKQTV